MKGNKQQIQQNRELRTSNKNEIETKLYPGIAELLQPPTRPYPVLVLSILLFSFSVSLHILKQIQVEIKAATPPILQSPS